MSNADLLWTLMTKLHRDEPVMLNILDKICNTLGCNYGDIMDYVPDEDV